MGWSASGAAAETWNCTVNQETAREEETSVQHELPIAYFYFISMLSWYLAAKTLLNSCLVAHWCHYPLMTAVARRHWCSARRYEWFFIHTMIGKHPFASISHTFLCTKCCKLSKCYKSLVSYIKFMFEIFANPFCQKQPGHVQLECNGSLSTTKAARCCKGGWTHPALVHEPSPLQSEYDIIYWIVLCITAKHVFPCHSLIFDCKSKGHIFAPDCLYCATNAARLPDLRQLFAPLHHSDKPQVDMVFFSLTCLQMFCQYFGTCFRYI